MEDGLDKMIAQLQLLEGAAFWQQLAAITQRREFRILEEGIFSALVLEFPDFDQLLDAARKAVSFGYTVYILPNPKGTKSADFIFKRKGIYHLYELKTILGNNSVANRLKDASSQANRILLHLTLKYNPRKLAKELTGFMNNNPSVLEVMIFFRKKSLLVKRASCGPDLCRILMGFLN